jgi:hypothetical protein
MLTSDINLGRATPRAALSSSPARILVFSIFFLGVVIASSAGSPLPAQQKDARDQTYYIGAHPYLDEPLKELEKKIPELKDVYPAADEAALPVILEKTGRNVDDFFRHTVDLIAREDITQQRLNSMDAVVASQQVRDSYLIIRHGDELKANVEEYRMDSKGDRMEHVGLKQGYVVTFGFALICNYFSSFFQPESRFRYIGDQVVGSQDTYVVAFAQQPGLATLHVTMNGGKGSIVNMLMQGIAWVDKQNFQIIRMRTDLLAPHPEFGLDLQTTVVTFNKVQLLDVATPLWLPKEVKAYVRFKEPGPKPGKFFELRYQNDHRYEDYRRYRVSVKMKICQ